MKNNRRHFIKLAAVAAVGVSAPIIAKAAYAPYKKKAKKNKDGLNAARWAMVIDTTKLNTPEAIDKLAEVCHTVHNVPPGGGLQELKWLWHDSFKHTFPYQVSPIMSDEVKEERVYPLLCNHCADAPCVRVCPTKATFTRPDGIVAMDYHRCIGCRYCMAGCPYGARSFNWGDPQKKIDKSKIDKTFAMRMRGVVEKCNFCVERLAIGQMPACVEASEGAMYFGDLNDPDSEVRQVLRERFAIRRKPAGGTDPSVYYII